MNLWTQHESKKNSKPSRSFSSYQFAILFWLVFLISLNEFQQVFSFSLYFLYNLINDLENEGNSQAMIPFLTFLRLPLSTLILWLAWKRLSGGSSSNAQAINSYSSHCHAWAVGFILSQELFFGSILCCELLETCPKKLRIYINNKILESLFTFNIQRFSRS